MTARKATKKAAGKAGKGFTADERAAMRERARELKAEAQRGKGGKGGKQDGESDLLAKVAEMPDDDRVLAEKVHALVKAVAPALEARTWYGMPAYARDGKVIVFFQGAAKFKSRYATLGFSDQAKLDDGAMWATSFALKKLGPTEKTRIEALLKKAVS